MRKTLVILSGGLDSTVLAYHLRYHPEIELVGSLSVFYGQKHCRELVLAASTAKALGIHHTEVNLSSLVGSLASSLTGQGSVPEGHYAEENMKSTVVPNRNMILIALAAAVAISKGCEKIAYGAHAGDHAVYPDCRPEFVQAMQTALSRCDYNPVQLLNLFAYKTKADIVRLGIELGVDFRTTHTCYNGTEVACGRCGTCVERLEAFSLAGAEDPISYADREFWKQAVEGK
jgi:7-cyano-7-deazaguanine synthase